MQHGDFTKLAHDYNKYRPSYSSKLIRIIKTYFKKKKIICADIAAGTGIFSKKLLDHKLNLKYIIEPNKEMLSYSKLNLSKLNKIKFFQNYAERINIKDKSVDLITVASAFHWFDFNKSNKEFKRILRNDGVLALCWNSRSLSHDVVQMKIEKKISDLKGRSIKRKSSGKYIKHDQLRKKLFSTNIYKYVDYYETLDTIYVSKKKYIGAWKSVNDLQVQIGEKKFKLFINYIDKLIKKRQKIKMVYVNKLWIAKVKS